MKVERFVIEELGGLNTNFVEGLGKQPSALKNAAFTRLGGYEFWGETESFINLGDFNYPTILDETGFGVYGGTQFFMGLSPTTALDFTPTFSIPYTSVNSGTRAYYRRSEAGGLFQTGAFAYTPSGPVTEASAITVAKTSNVTFEFPESGLSPGTYHVWGVNYVDTENGRVLFTPTGDVSVTLDASESDWGIKIDITNPGPSRNKLVYIRHDTELGLAGFVGDFGAANSVWIKSRSQILGNSDIFIRMPNDGRSEFHQSRFYTAIPGYLTDDPPNVTRAGLGYRDALTTAAFPSLSGRNISRIYFTEVGYANLTKTLNFFDIPFRSSAAVLGMASTPAGLLVFGANESFLFRGDPAAGAELQRFSSSYGMDAGTRPAKLSGIVAFIYQGEIYLVSLGMGDIDFSQGVENISREVYDRNDKFVEIVADHARNTIICRTQDMRVLRYHVPSKRWSEDPFSSPGSPQTISFVPNGDVYGGAVKSPYYYYMNLASVTLRYVKHIGSGTMTFGWNDLDLGDKRAGKLWRSVEVYTNEEYDGEPLLTWRVGENTGVVSGRNKGKGIWVFVLPTGQTGPLADLIFTFPGMDSRDTIEPPVVISYVPRGRARTRYPAYEPPIGIL